MKIQLLAVLVASLFGCGPGSWVMQGSGSTGFRSPTQSPAAQPGAQPTPADQGISNLETVEVNGYPVSMEDLTIDDQGRVLSGKVYDTTDRVSIPIAFGAHVYVYVESWQTLTLSQGKYLKSITGAFDISSLALGKSCSVNNGSRGANYAEFYEDGGLKTYQSNYDCYDELQNLAQCYKPGLTITNVLPKGCRLDINSTARVRAKGQ